MIFSHSTSHPSPRLYLAFRVNLLANSGFVRLRWQLPGSSRDPLAGNSFFQKDIEARLNLLGLPRTNPLSVLAVEVLPGPLNFPPNVKSPGRDDSVVEDKEDPVGCNLGLRRFLRTSPLTAVPAIC